MYTNIYPISDRIIHVHVTIWQIQCSTGFFQLSSKSSIRVDSKTTIWCTPIFMYDALKLNVNLICIFAKVVIKEIETNSENVQDCRVEQWRNRDLLHVRTIMNFSATEMHRKNFINCARHLFLGTVTVQSLSVQYVCCANKYIISIFSSIHKPVQFSQ